MLVAAPVLWLAKPSYQAEAQIQIGARATGLIGLRTHVLAQPKSVNPSEASGQVQLVASRDLARRAIEDLGIDAMPEFDPLARGLGPASRALVLLGLKRDPARLSPQERVLQSYEERLIVSAESHAKLVTIAFRSEDRRLAADAANRIADLFLEMRAKAGPAPLDARIVSRATAPRDPIYPPQAVVAAFGLSASLVMAFGVFAASAYWQARHRALPNVPAPQPQPIGPLPLLTAPPTLPDPPLPRPIEDHAEPDRAQGPPSIAAQILRERRGQSGLCILVTSRAKAPQAPQQALALGRELGASARTIIVWLDPDFDTINVAGTEPVPGFSEVAAGCATFAQAIRRDPASRLHFLSAGQGTAIDRDQAANVIDTLTRTYDFVLLLAPPLGLDGIARSLAEKARFVILYSSSPEDNAGLRMAKTELAAEGVQDILTMGPSVRLRRRAAPSLVATRPATPRDANDDTRGLLRRRASPST